MTAAGHMYPGGHGEIPVALTTVVPYHPLGTGLHTDAAGLSWYVPSAQPVQAAAPSEDWAEPGGQALHETWPELSCNDRNEDKNRVEAADKERQYRVDLFQAAPLVHGMIKFTVKFAAWKSQVTQAGELTVILICPSRVGLLKDCRWVLSILMPRPPGWLKNKPCSWHDTASIAQRKADASNADLVLPRRTIHAAVGRAVGSSCAWDHTVLSVGVSDGGWRGARFRNAIILKPKIPKQGHCRVYQWRDLDVNLRTPCEQLHSCESKSNSQSQSPCTGASDHRRRVLTVI